MSFQKEYSEGNSYLVYNNHCIGVLLESRDSPHVTHTLLDCLESSQANKHNASKSSADNNIFVKSEPCREQMPCLPQ